MRSTVAATTTNAYDRASNLKTVKDARQHGGAFDVSYDYDARYRRIAETNGENETTSYRYDAAGNRTAMIEPLGPDYRTEYRYGELNELIAIDETPRQDAVTAAGVTRFLYDANRNKIAQQDANENLVTYEYDALNRQTAVLQHLVKGSVDEAQRESDPGGNPGTALDWHTTYDENGNVDTVVDARGQHVHHGYDHLARRTSTTYTQHADPDLDFQMQSVGYQYDGNGNAEITTEVKRIGGQDRTGAQCPDLGPAGSRADSHALRLR